MADGDDGALADDVEIYFRIKNWMVLMIVRDC